MILSSTPPGGRIGPPCRGGRAPRGTLWRSYWIRKCLGIPGNSRTADRVAKSIREGKHIKNQRSIWTMSYNKEIFSLPPGGQAHGGYRPGLARVVSQLREISYRRWGASSFCSFPWLPVLSSRFLENLDDEFRSFEEGKCLFQRRKKVS